MTTALNKEFKFSHPGTYHIQVAGSVSPALWNYFEGEVEQVSQDKRGNVKTSLLIRVRDQAELTGLINLLYNYQLILLSVKVDGLNDDSTII